QAGSGITRSDNELGIAVSPGLLAVTGQEVGPAGSQIPGQMLDDLGNTIGEFSRLPKELRIVQLIERLLGHSLLFAEAEKDILSVRLPKRHADTSSSHARRMRPLQMSVTTRPLRCPITSPVPRTAPESSYDCWQGKRATD